MDADGVEVFHGADGDDVRHRVAHDLELDLLPPGDGLLHEHLSDGGETQPVRADFNELLHIGDDAAAGAAQGEGGPDDEREADFLGKCLGVRERRDDLRRDDRLANGEHRFLEELAVLRLVDGLGLGAQEPDVVLFKDAILRQLHRQRQTRLAAERTEEAVRLFLLDDAFQDRDRERLDINPVGHVIVGHDGGGV